MILHQSESARPVTPSLSVSGANMAATAVLPTYQRYINGVPVTQARRTLRLREKYIVLLVFVTFGTVCFGAFFFLPDLRQKVVQDGIFLPEPIEDRQFGLPFRHHPGEDFDEHRIVDKNILDSKIQNSMKGYGPRVTIRPRLNVTVFDHALIQKAIAEDKQRVVKDLAEKQDEKKEEEKKEALRENKDHEGVLGGQGGQPEDEETKTRRDKVREVNSRRVTYTYTID